MYKLRRIKEVQSRERMTLQLECCYVKLCLDLSYNLVIIIIIPVDLVNVKIMNLLTSYLD